MATFWLVFFFVFLAAAGLFLGKTVLNRPVSVDYYFTSPYCAADGCDQSTHADVADAQHALRLLQAAGMTTLTLTGGAEPFLYPVPLGALVDFAKQELRLHRVAVVSGNGALIHEDWLKAHAHSLDALILRIDEGTEAQSEILGRVARWCEAHGVLLQLETAVDRDNRDADMGGTLRGVGPVVWKCYRGRSAAGTAISEAEFDAFCERNTRSAWLALEDSRVSGARYFVLDYELRLVEQTGWAESVDQQATMELEERQASDAGVKSEENTVSQENVGVKSTAVEFKNVDAGGDSMVRRGKEKAVKGYVENEQFYDTSGEIQGEEQAKGKDERGDGLSFNFGL